LAEDVFWGKTDVQQAARAIGGRVLPVD
jgi:hypothetical protein